MKIRRFNKKLEDYEFVNFKTFNKEFKIGQNEFVDFGILGMWFYFWIFPPLNQLIKLISK